VVALPWVGLHVKADMVFFAGNTDPYPSELEVFAYMCYTN